MGARFWGYVSRAHSGHRARVAGRATRRSLLTGLFAGGIVLGARLRALCVRLHEGQASAMGVAEGTRDAGRSGGSAEC